MAPLSLLPPVHPSTLPVAGLTGLVVAFSAPRIISFAFSYLFHLLGREVLNSPAILGAADQGEGGHTPGNWWPPQVIRPARVPPIFFTAGCVLLLFCLLTSYIISYIYAQHMRTHACRKTFSIAGIAGIARIAGNTGNDITAGMLGIAGKVDECRRCLQCQHCLKCWQCWHC